PEELQGLSATRDRERLRAEDGEVDGGRERRLPHREDVAARVAEDQPASALRLVAGDALVRDEPGSVRRGDARAVVGDAEEMCLVRKEVERGASDAVGAEKPELRRAGGRDVDEASRRDAPATAGEAVRGARPRRLGRDRCEEEDQKGEAT